MIDRRQAIRLTLTLVAAYLVVLFLAFITRRPDHDSPQL